MKSNYELIRQSREELVYNENKVCKLFTYVKCALSNCNNYFFLSLTCYVVTTPLSNSWSCT